MDGEWLYSGRRAGEIEVCPLYGLSDFGEAMPTGAADVESGPGRS